MIIGLSGYAGAGKDTVADILVREHGFTRVAFADKLKEFAYNVNPIIDVDTWQDEWEPSNFGAYPVFLRDVVDSIGWDEAKRRFPGVRQALQRTGVAARETFGEDFWVDQVADHIEATPGSFIRGAVNWVIPDVRFPNEARYIQSWRQAGAVIRVNREGVAAVNGHVSEHALDGWEFDGLVENNGSLDDLRSEVATLLGSL